MKLITKVAAAQPLSLPRIGKLVRVLNDELPELYAELDTTRPELSAVAALLAEHYSDMPPDTKLFRTFSTRDVFKAVNPAVLRLPNEIAKQVKNVADTAGFTGLDDYKHLVNVALGEALHIAYYAELRNDPKAMLSAIVEKQIDGALYKTAALPHVDNKHEGPGKKFRAPHHYRVPESKAPSFSDVTDLYANLTYNTAFNALVTAPTVLASNDETTTTISNLKSQLAVNFENHYFLSLAHKELKNQLASGRKLFARGNPLSPNPSIGTFFGATHDDWFGSEAEPNNRYRPESILQLFANGSLEEQDTPYLPNNILSRKALYGKENPNLIVEEWSGRAATQSTKVLSQKYMDNEAKFKSDLASTLVKGFEANLAALRGNGIPLAKYKNVLGIADETVLTATKEALIKILARLPTKMEAGPENAKVQMNLAQIADLCEKAIDAERSAFAAKVQAKNPAFVAANPDFKDFLGAAAQLTLRLPIVFAKKFEGFNPMGTLPPIPRQKETKLGDIHPGIAKYFGEYSNTSFTDLMSSLSKSYRGMPGTAAVINILNNSKDKSVSLFGNARKMIDARKAGGEADAKVRQAFREKLTLLFNRIEENVDSMPDPKLEQKTNDPSRQEKESIRSLISELRKDEKSKKNLVAVIFAACLDSIGVPFAKINIAALMQAIESQDNDAAALYEVAQAVSDSLPTEINTSAESDVESKYSNFSEYKKTNGALLEKDDVELKLNANHSASRAALMFEGSMLNGLRVMMSNAYVSRFDSNAQADTEFVKKNYREDVPTEVELLRAKSLEDAATMLQNQGILEKLGLSFEDYEQKVEPFDKNKKKYFSDNERKRQNSAGQKFQLFFENNSRETLKQKLRQLGLDADLNIDPLVVLLARKMHILFSSSFDLKLEQSNLGVRAGAAEGVTDAQRAQAKEMQGGNAEEDEAPDQGRYAEQSDYSKFATDWGTKIRFHQSGGLSTQCLAGFLSETLAKNDLSKKDGLDGEWARKYRGAFDTDNKPGGGRTVAPIIGLAMNRVAWAYGKVNHDANIEQLNILFAQQEALGRKPGTISELTVMEKVPFDPIYGAKTFSGGRTTDKISQTYRILRRTRVAGTDNFEDFLLDFRTALLNFQREMDVAIADLPTLEAKDLCNRLIAESKQSTNPMWAPSPDDVKMLKNLGAELSETGQIRDLRLWKMAFNSPEGATLIAKFVKDQLKTKDEAQVRSVIETVKNSRLVKTSWQNVMDGVLGKTGLLDKDDIEKLSISLGALKTALAENVEFILLSEEEQNELARRTTELHNAQEADTEMAEAVEKKVISGGAKMSALMEAFTRAEPDLQALQIAAQGDDVVMFDNDYADDTDAATMRTAAEKTYTIARISRNNPALLDKEAANFVGEISDAIDEDNWDKEIEALNSTSAKNLYSKFSKLAPTYFTALNQRINEKLALLKSEVLRFVENSEQADDVKSAVKIARDLQKQTAHLATYQGWSAEGADICLAQVPRLPKTGKYKKTFQGFVEYNEKRISNWLMRLKEDKLVSSIDIIDEEMREDGKSLLDLSTESLANILDGEDDVETLALAQDSVIRKIFETKTRILNKRKQVMETQAMLAEINDEEFEKFEADFDEAQKTLADTFKQELGMPLNKVILSDSSEDDDLELVEDDEFDLTEEDITDDEFVQVGPDLTEKEKGQRANAALGLEKMIGAVQAILMRPKMHPLYRQVGKEFAKDLLDIVQDISFTSKFNHLQMQAATEVLKKTTSEMIAAGESLIATDAAPEQYELAADSTIEFFEKKLGEVELALGARDEKVTPIKVDIKQPTDSKAPPLPTREQRLNSELVASMKNVDEAISLSEKASPEYKALNNVRMLLNALAPENRVMGPTVDSKGIIRLVESVTQLINSEQLFNCTPTVMLGLMADLRKLGIGTKIPVEFNDLEEKQTDQHETAKALFDQIKTLNQQIGGYILKVPEEAKDYIATIDIHYEDLDEVMDKVEQNRSYNVLSEEDVKLLNGIKATMEQMVNDLRNARSAQDFAKLESDRSLIIEPAELIAQLFDELKRMILEDLRAKKAALKYPRKISGKWVI